jgi:hypothetical protein
VIIELSFAESWLGCAPVIVKQTHASGGGDVYADHGHADFGRRLPSRLRKNAAGWLIVSDVQRLNGEFPEDVNL